MIVEVLGVEPPCHRCKKTLEAVNKAVSELHLENCSISKLNSYSPLTIEKYGVVFTPAVAINGKIVVSGRLPNEKELKKLLAKNVSLESGQK